MDFKRLFNRLLQIALPVLALAVMTSSSLLAQDDTRQLLTPGESVSGEIDEANAAQVYAFQVTTAGTASLQISADEDLILTAVVTDAFGNLVAQGIDIANSGVIGLNLNLTTTGLYYVTVFPTAGTDTELTGGFTIQVSGTAVAAPEVTATEEPASTDVPTTPTTASERTFPPGEVLTNQGIQVSLTWETTSDLNLQVRDPDGRTLFFNSTTTDNGGTFGFDVNGLCEVLTPADQAAVETAEWGAGAVATGSYEILVFYRQDCENVGAVPFAIDVTVDGQALPTIEATLDAPPPNASSVYLASFIVNSDATAVYGPNGPYTDTRVLPEPAETYLNGVATPLVPDLPVNGLITSDNYYQLYSFTGTSSQPVTISMAATNGNLDTLLLVIDATGRVVADNDDVVAADVTNSAIENLLLPLDGTYTVIATRYGKNVGGTEGNYTLLLSNAQAGLPDEVASLNLPEGDIEVTLVWNTNADLQLLVRDPAGAAVFDDEPSVQSGGQLVSTGNRNCTVSATTPPAYYIYWPENRARGGSYEVEVWYQNNCNDTTPVSATLYITVNDVLLAQTDIAIDLDERYLTSFTIDSSGNPVISDGGIVGGLETIDFTTEQPQTILYGSQMNNIISPTNKFDVYTFTGAAGDVVTIAMTRVNGNVDTLLFLVGPDGFEVARNDDADPGNNTNSIILEQSLPLDGTYTIIATHYGTIYGGTTGGYTLSLTRE